MFTYVHLVFFPHLVQNMSYFDDSEELPCPSELCNALVTVPISLYPEPVCPPLMNSSESEWTHPYYPDLGLFPQRTSVVIQILILVFISHRGNQSNHWTTPRTSQSSDILLIIAIVPRSLYPIWPDTESDPSTVLSGISPF